jgi:hypothetical protein
MATFDTYKYTDDQNLTHPIRIEDSRALPGGMTKSDVFTSDVPALVSLEPGQSGLRARRVMLYRTTGTGASKKRYSSYLVVGTKAALALFKKNQLVPIGGKQWKVRKRVDESYGKG